MGSGRPSAVTCGDTTGTMRPFAERFAYDGVTGTLWLCEVYVGSIVEYSALGR
jgi:hypothetical protein